MELHSVNLLEWNQLRNVLAQLSNWFIRQQQINLNWELHWIKYIWRQILRLLGLDSFFLALIDRSMPHSLIRSFIQPLLANFNSAFIMHSGLISLVAFLLFPQLFHSIPALISSLFLISWFKLNVFSLKSMK